jgi:hypothetical protein
MDEKLMKELRQIRNLLILVALTSGASADEVGQATGMGRTNVSALIPRRKKNKKGR